MHSGLKNNMKGMLIMDILNEDRESASRKKHDEMLNDPVFAGKSFSFLLVIIRKMNIAVKNLPRKDLRMLPVKF